MANPKVLELYPPRRKHNQERKQSRRRKRKRGKGKKNLFYIKYIIRFAILCIQAKLTHQSVMSQF